jgi:hypothetical protein
MDPLKFIALDQQDLEVVSAHLQDAVVSPAEILWRPKEHRLVIGLGRFDWDAAQGTKPEYRRRRSALRFERVRSCQARGIDPGKDKVLSLLAVEFAATDAPSGVVSLIFSGQATFRLEVECLEAELVDLGPSWTEAACPAHLDTDGDQPA